ncbi:hypothetical protein [Rhodopirellula sp. P2]|uniref:hypothetical protein n=1 Tax=Rhodopirellula sp. P2 TaxID=2127060 RepID=UPI002368BAC1|nr:hypothetical protein [Rhodopirellula sp. P2]WDQ17179.1 hypothetical protein PSR62_01175 [Rhodopirellula sp. P2]
MHRPSPLGQNPNAKNPSTEQPAKPKQWQLEEWECIATRRQKAYASVTKGQETSLKGEPKNLTGLALSGGGIRSALFNDGFLQALSHRGLLRYVDYLASVSGGGYIAGHLMAQSDKTSEKCFHDDNDRAALGRDPVTGKIANDRLPGIGGYLSRPLEFIPAYLWSFFFSLAFYLGIVGVISTVAALLWRSFDNIQFREIYSSSLGLNQFGDELTIAFLPTLFVLLLLVTSELILTVCRCSSKLNGQRLIKIHRWFRATTLLAAVFAALTSIAIFLGNGKSFVESGTNTLYLNRYVQYFAITAGVIQVLVFLGRDRLFRSERGEAKGWQRHVQYAVTTLVIITMVFSMVHWMGRENISNYTKFRDPHLVVGDVQDWKKLQAIGVAYPNKSNIDLPDFDSEKVLLPTVQREVVFKSGQIAPKGRWHLAVAKSRLNLFGYDKIKESDLSEPSPPAVQGLLKLSQEDRDENKVAVYQAGTETWLLPKRLLAAAYAYWQCVLVGPKTADREGSEPIEPLIENVTLQQAQNMSVYETVDDIIAAYRLKRARQEKYLTGFNQFLDQPEFTQFLLSRINLRLAPPTESGPDNNAAAENSSINLNQFLTSSALQLTDSQRKSLTTHFHSLNLDAPAARSEEGSPNDAFLEPAVVNRLLLEGLYPAVIQRHDVASTLVVPPHDQRTRQRWLIGWTLLLFVGLIGGLGPHRVATVFHFYRRQLTANFLVPTDNPDLQYGENPLKSVQPYEDGLPYPLILAGALKPSSRNGSYRVAARPFVFSPLYSGSFEDGEEPFDSEQLSFGRNPKTPPLTLADAVTLSGAAITPLMSQNRWLTIILDFFNTGIGQRVCRTDRTKANTKPSSDRWPLQTLLACLLIGLVYWQHIGFGWSLALVFATTALFCQCWSFFIGSPGWIRSLTFLPETYHEVQFNQNQSFYIADGGYVDYLGVSELLRRRCELIIVSDAGANVGGDSLGTLARMCQRAESEQGIRFLDLDHEAPIDFGRLEIDDQSRLVHQPFICMRVRYPEANREEGMLVYCQMSITGSDPIEIKNIRNLFPSFPDEPTVNQFYNDKQVAAYRALGYHIGKRFCSELYPWFDKHSKLPPQAATPPKSSPPKQATSHRKKDKPSKYKSFVETLKNGFPDTQLGTQLPSQQPLFRIVGERLLTAYRLACYQEITYNKDDIFGEAVWTGGEIAFPSLPWEIQHFSTEQELEHDLSNHWLKRYELNPDLRSAYRAAVIEDINSLGVEADSYCGALWTTLRERQGKGTALEAHLAAHLTCIAVACQEIHRGRPNAAFQVGGRDKLIDLCGRIANQIAKVAPVQFQYTSIDQMFKDLDGTIAELIEMERSIFQGGEHVATISFAQCMSSAWGRMAREFEIQSKQAETISDFTFTQRVFQTDGVLGMFEQRGNETPQSIETFDLITAEIRHQLDIGMKEIRLKAIRNGLAKSWYTGFFNADQLESFKTSWGDSSDDKAPAKSTAKSPSQTKK